MHDFLIDNENSFNPKVSEEQYSVVGLLQDYEYGLNQVRIQTLLNLAKEFNLAHFFLIRGAVVSTDKHRKLFEYCLLNSENREFKGYSFQESRAMFVCVYNAYVNESDFRKFVNQRIGVEDLRFFQVLFKLCYDETKDLVLDPSVPAELIGETEFPIKNKTVDKKINGGDKLKNNSNRNEIVKGKGYIYSYCNANSTKNVGNIEGLNKEDDNFMIYPSVNDDKRKNNLSIVKTEFVDKRNSDNDQIITSNNSIPSNQSTAALSRSDSNSSLSSNISPKRAKFENYINHLTEMGYASLLKKLGDTKACYDMFRLEVTCDDIYNKTSTVNNICTPSYLVSKLKLYGFFEETSSHFSTYNSYFTYRLGYKRGWDGAESTANGTDKCKKSAMRMAYAHLMQALFEELDISYLHVCIYCNVKMKDLDKFVELNRFTKGKKVIPKAELGNLSSVKSESLKRGREDS